MAKNPKRTKEEPADKGLYQQRRGWWYRFSYGGKQHFVNLYTTDKDEAIGKKRYLIETKTLITPKMAVPIWEKAVDEYLDKRISEGRIRKAYRGRVKSALMIFAAHSKVGSPVEVNLAMLQEFYHDRRKNSEAGARSSINTVQAFLKYLGVLHKRVEFVRNSKPESRQEIATMAEINEWIEACDEPPLKFVLYCLGNLGMRAGEVKQARREWFDENFINIPAKQIYKLRDGTFAEWRTKDNDSRQIPLPPKIRDFLSGFLKGKKGLVNSSDISKDFIWDFKLPLKLHMKKVGRPSFYPHAFRHSWITSVMNDGKTIQQVSAWSGDSIQTLERNYWKKKVIAGELDDVIEGRKKKTPEEVILETMKSDQFQALMLANMTEAMKVLNTKAANENRQVTAEEMLEVFDEAMNKVTDEKILSEIRRKMADVKKDETLDNFFEGMTPQQIADFYKENGLDPNEPIFVAYGELED